MLRFKPFLNEELILEAARVSTYSDEHAFKHMWNHGVSTGNHNADHLSSEIEKAKKNPKHPLSVENNGSVGFKSGTDIHSPEARGHYYNELHKAAQTVAGLVKHTDFAKAAKSGHKASVAGASRGELTPEWKSHGTTDRTSKADIHIGSAKTPHAIRVSYKDSGGSQLAAAGPEQTSATVTHASHELMKDKSSDYTKEHHDQVVGHMKTLAKHMNAARDASNEEERSQSLVKAQAAHHKMMAVHPGLADHIAREAASGEGQFGKGSASSATHLVSTFNPKTSQVKVKKTSDIKASDVAKVRVSKGKGMSGGKFRTHLMRMDLKS
jgi:hypothetical protein